MAVVMRVAVAACRQGRWSEWKRTKSRPSAAPPTGSPEVRVGAASVGDEDLCAVGLAGRPSVRSVARDLSSTIDTWAHYWNEDPQPFIWTRMGNDITAKSHGDEPSSPRPRNIIRIRELGVSAAHL